jgi:hypothetical protein
MEAFIECKPADDTKKHMQHPGCFGFIRAWLEKRSLKKKEKRLKKKAKFYEADDTANIGLVIDAWETDGVKRIAFN